MALTHSPQGGPGTPCPLFKLPTTQGNMVETPELLKTQRPFLVMFICNHCPYVQAIENRLIAMGHLLEALGIKVLAISSNDSNHYPEDSFENMKAKNYSFAYAYDQDQMVAKSFGAVCTPDFFVYDKNGLLAYRGRLDNHWKSSQEVTQYELLEAILKLDYDLSVGEIQNSSMGCSIKWNGN